MDIPRYTHSVTYAIFSDTKNLKNKLLPESPMNSDFFLPFIAQKHSGYGDVLFCVPGRNTCPDSKDFCCLFDFPTTSLDNCP